MKVLRLKGNQFENGEHYSMMLSDEKPLINAKFFQSRLDDSSWKFYFKENTGMRIFKLTGSPTTEFEVILHEKEQFYIMVDNAFLIGTFTNRTEAETFLEKNLEVISQLNDTTDIVAPTVADKKYVDAYAAEIFWNNRSSDREKVSDYTPLFIDHLHDVLEDHLTK